MHVYKTYFAKESKMGCFYSTDLRYQSSMPCSNLFSFFFFLQGDKEAELGLPFSPLCDRKSTMVAQSQIGMSLLVHCK